MPKLRTERFSCSAKSARAAMAAGLLLALPLRAAGRNLIMIGWDTLRADHVSANGYTRQTTPNIDKLAARSFNFTNAISPASWTIPAFMSIFTSLYPTEHGMTNFLNGSPARRLSSRAVTIAQFLKANGYRTAAFTGGAGVIGALGFGNGFDVYVDSRQYVCFDTTFPEAIAWLKSNPGSKYFLFIHGYDTHTKHQLEPDAKYRFLTPPKEADPPVMPQTDAPMPPPDNTSLDIDAYDEKTARADELLGKFLKELAAVEGPGADTDIILVSDHGEELFDHGNSGHGSTLYDEVLHVPLIIFARRLGSGKIDAQVGTIDLFPTIIELLELEPDNKLKRQIRGTSLIALMKGEAGARDVYSETDFMNNIHKRSLRKSGGMKLISDLLPKKLELYNIAADAKEMKDISETDADSAYALETRLFKWVDGLKPFQ